MPFPFIFFFCYSSNHTHIGWLLLIYSSYSIALGWLNFFPSLFTFFFFLKFIRSHLIIHFFFFLREMLKWNVERYDCNLLNERLRDLFFFFFSAFTFTRNYAHKFDYNNQLACKSSADAHRLR